ncbi:hypothetical protein D3C85_1450780 [compost metagenome]
MKAWVRKLSFAAIAATHLKGAYPKGGYAAIADIPRPRANGYYRPQPDIHKQVRLASMTRSRTPLETAAGKLIAAIQKEWGIEAGGPEAAASEEAMHAAHGLLQAASKFGAIESVIGSSSVATYLGEQWVQAHPQVLPYIEALEGAQ